MDEKLLRTMQVYDSYERRFAQARAGQPLRRPWLAGDREEILAAARDVLSFREPLIPAIRPLSGALERFEGYSVEHLLFESWERFYGSASLYRPDGGGKRPLVLVCPGHGEEGRLTDCYQRMAQRLALQGAYVLLSDNIGQGERAPFGHAHCVAPFYCGLTLQGLIVMETVAWVRYLAAQPFVDETRIGACGNSGGGTLCTFLAALCPELAALSASGYPSEFGYILQKERRHCACNLLPRYAGRLEMWELLSLFAPRPLLLEQGTLDNLIPFDLFRRNARKVQAAYEQLGAGDRFQALTTPTTHSWTSQDRFEIASFLARSLGLDPAFPEDDDALLPPLCDPALPHVVFPEDALTTDQLAQALTGVSMPEGTRLQDVFVPQFEGRPLDPASVRETLGPNEVMRVLAQFECCLQPTGKIPKLP